jgi:hypothetical protein
LVQALAQQIGSLGMIVDVITKRGFEGQLGRGMAPAGDHLQQLNFQITIIGETLRIFPDSKAAAKFTTVYNRHLNLL